MEFDDESTPADAFFPQDVPIWRGPGAKVDEITLVLLAAGLPHRVARSGSDAEVRVPRESAGRAHEELERFAAENENRAQALAAERPRAMRGTGRGVVAALLWFLHLAATTAIQASIAHGESFHRAVLWPRAFRRGEVWRAVTALGLHGDAMHLSTNLFFGALFSFLLGETIGVGAAFGGTLIAGTLGNAMSAMLKAPDMTSIGASTAVFAALGILGAVGFDPDRPRPTTLLGRFKRFGPVLGAVALLALYGGAERSSDAFSTPGLVVGPNPGFVEAPKVDVLAHTTGFLAGLALGFLVGLRPSRFASARTQWTIGLSGLILSVAAWAAILFSR